MHEQSKTINNQRKPLDLPVERLKTIIPPSFNAFPSLNNEDSFFDALVQCLNQANLEKQYDIKALCQLCSTYARDNKKNAWVKEAVAKKGLKYEDYLASLAFTVTELTKNKEQAILRIPEIEGRMICDVLRVKIQIIEVSDQDENNKNQVTTAYLVNPYGFEDLQLQNTKQVRQFITESSVQLIKCGKHFVPLLRNTDLAKLPDDALAHIFRFFNDPRQIIKTSEVCKKWQKVVNNETYKFWSKFGYESKQDMKEGELAKVKAKEIAGKLVPLCGSKKEISVALVGVNKANAEKFYSKIKSSSGGSSNGIAYRIMSHKGFDLGFLMMPSFDEKISEQNNVNPNLSIEKPAAFSISSLKCIKDSKIIFFFADKKEDLECLKKLDCTDKLIFVIAKEEYKKSNGNQIYHYLIADVNDNDFKVPNLLDAFVKKIFELAPRTPRSSERDVSNSNNNNSSSAPSALGSIPYFTFT